MLEQLAQTVNDPLIIPGAIAIAALGGVLTYGITKGGGFDL